jgi:GDP-L-fucose synthase
MSAETGYGAAKRTGEDLACTFRGALIVRPFSGYASDQDPAYPYRAILERIRRREDPLIVWGSGTQVRDWTHADDLVQVVLSLAVETQVTGPVNIGTGQGTSVAALARMMAAAAGYTPRILSVSNRPEGVASRVADVTVLRRMLGPDGHDVLLRPIWTVIEDTPPAVWDVQA